MKRHTQMKRMGMDTLTELNWQEALGIAVQLLPGASVQWDSENEAAVSTVVEPKSGPCKLKLVRVRFFSTLRDHGWPVEMEYMFGPGGSFEYVSDRPIISLCGDRLAPEQIVFADEIGTEDLARKLRRTLWHLTGCPCATLANTAAATRPVEAHGGLLTISAEREGEKGQPRCLIALAGLDAPCSV